MSVVTATRRLDGQQLKRESNQETQDSDTCVIMEGSWGGGHEEGWGQW